MVEPDLEEELFGTFDGPAELPAASGVKAKLAGEAALVPSVDSDLSVAKLIAEDADDTDYQEDADDECDALLGGPPKTEEGVEATLSLKHKQEDAPDADASLTTRVLWSMADDPSFYVIVFLAAFVQGSEGGSGLAVQYLMKDDMALEPATLATISGITTLPWVVKPLWGFISDGVPILGYRKRSYLFLAGLLNAVCWVVLASVPAWTLLNIVAIRFCSSMTTAFLSTVSKALIVQKCAGRQQDFASFLQSYFWGTSYAFHICGVFLTGYCLERGLSKRVVFWVTACFPLAVAIAAPFIAEAHDVRCRSMKSQFLQLVSVFRGNDPESYQRFPIWRPALFMFLFAATPSSGTAMFYFFTERLGFDEQFISITSMVGTATSLVGIVVYQLAFSKAQYRSVLAWASVVSTVFGLLPIVVIKRWNLKMHIPDQAFILTDDAMGAAIGQIAIFPLFVMAARICPPGVEGTLYALLMSISNLGGIISSQLSALTMSLLHISRTDFSHLPTMIITNFIINLLPLSLICLLLPEDSEGQSMSTGASNTPPPSPLPPQDCEGERTDPELSTLRSRPPPSSETS